MEQGYKHLMIDLETMGTKSFSSIVSIGALEFDIDTGTTGREFLVNIDLEDCCSQGLKIDPSTVMWWLSQSKGAQESLLNKDNSFGLIEALDKLIVYIGENSFQVWGNSALFDLGLLGNAYDITHIERPWKFYNERCVRTLCSFYPEIKKNEPFEGVAHNALADCYHQVKYCHKTWTKLKQ